MNGKVASRGVRVWYIAGAEGRFNSEYMFYLGEGDVIRWGGWGK